MSLTSKWIGLSLFITVLSSSPLQAGGYIAHGNPGQLLEHLVRLSDALMTEVNLIRADQAAIAPAVVVQFQTSPGWNRRLVHDLLSDPRDRRSSVDFFIGRLVNQFRTDVIFLFEIWGRSRKSTSELQEHYKRTSYSYLNATAAGYFYIEALRRTFLTQNAVSPCDAARRAVLVGRFSRTERLLFDLRELMHLVKHVEAFQLPLGRRCVECTFRPIRISIDSVRAQDVPALPYFYNNQVWAPSNVSDTKEHPDRFTPTYDPNPWNQRWNFGDPQPPSSTPNLDVTTPLRPGGLPVPSYPIPQVPGSGDDVVPVPDFK